MRFRALVLPLAVATRTTASSRANASFYFSCDGDKVFAGGVFAPVKGRLQVSDHAPQCFIDQDIFGGDERMPPLRGKWIQDQDNVAVLGSQLSVRNESPQLCSTQATRVARTLNIPEPCGMYLMFAGLTRSMARGLCRA